MKRSDSSVSTRTLRSIMASCCGAVEARGGAEQAEARVVDQELRLKAVLAQLVLDPRGGVGPGRDR